MNRAFLYIRAKCNAKEAEGKLLELAQMTTSTGIPVIDGDVVVEFDHDLEGKCLEDLKDAISSGQFNIVIFDQLESISADITKAEAFVRQLVSSGAFVLVKKDKELVAVQGVNDGSFCT